MNLFTETDFKDTYKWFADQGMHQQQNLTFKKQEMLVRIIESLLSAMKALERNDRFDMNTSRYMELEGDYMHVLGTFEDKVANTVILCYDYAGCWRLKKTTIEKGYEEIFRERDNGYKQSLKEVEESYNKEFSDNGHTKILNPTAYCLSIIKCLTDAYYGSFGGNDVGSAMGKISLLCAGLDIDLKWHVRERMNYLKKQQL
jgi:hypothetical protein